VLTTRLAPIETRRVRFGAAGHEPALMAEHLEDRVARDRSLY
jgi:hypothetical protein